MATKTTTKKTRRTSKRNASKGSVSKTNDKKTRKKIEPVSNEMSFDNEEDFDQLDKQTEGGDFAKVTHTEIKTGANFIALAQTGYSVGYQHWLTVDGNRIPYASLNQKKGFDKENDPVDAYASELYSEADELDKDGNKDKAKKVKDKASAIVSSFVAKFLVYEGESVIRETSKGDVEVVRFGSKKEPTEASVLSLSKARTRGFKDAIRDWIDADAGVAKDFKSPSDVIDYVIKIVKDKKKKTFKYVLFCKLTSKHNLPELDESILAEYKKHIAESFTPDEDKLEKSFEDHRSGRKSNDDDDSQLDDDDPDDDDDEDDDDEKSPL